MNGTTSKSRFIEIIIACAIILLTLYYGRTLFIPMCYGLFIAIVLYPLCKWLEKHYFSRSMAIAAGLSIVVVIFLALLLLVELQIDAFRKDIPELKAKIQPLIISAEQWIQSSTGINISTQQNWLHTVPGNISSNPAEFISGTLSKTIDAFFTLFMTPVFAALFLYNREDFALFTIKVFGKTNIERTKHVLHQTISTYYHFIKGMVMVYIIVGILNSAGLMALGIRHAILFGFLTAIMTIIPYIGLFISALLPVAIAWITKDSIWYPIGVIAVFTFVQYLEANVIFPRVVAAQLNVSTWATLVALIAGGILWGVSGMILFIPLVGIFKIATDNIPEWEAINILLRRKSGQKKTDLSIEEQQRSDQKNK